MIFHIHSFPGCGSTCNTACSAAGGAATEINCVEIKFGQNAGQWGCIHTGTTPGVPPTDESLRAEVQFFQDLVEKGLLEVAGDREHESGHRRE
jgi:hypothetical protein